MLQRRLQCASQAHEPWVTEHLCKAFACAAAGLLEPCARVRTQCWIVLSVNQQLRSREPTFPTRRERELQQLQSQPLASVLSVRVHALHVQRLSSFGSRVSVCSRCTAHSSVTRAGTGPSASTRTSVRGG